MVFTSSYPVTVDGVRLDTLAWNIRSLAGRRRLPSLRATSLTLPGVHGETFVPGDVYETGQVALSMFVRGTDADGSVPVGEEPLERFHKNLDALFALFSQPHKLLDLRITVAPGEVRQADARVITTVTPDDIRPGASGFFEVLFSLPGVFWRDVSGTTFVGDAAITDATTLTLTNFSGSTAPIVDSHILISGPATNPRVTDVATGAWLQFDGTIGNGSHVRLRPGAFAAEQGTSMSVRNTGGADVFASVSNGGNLNAHLLPLTPVMVSGDPHDRRVSLLFNATGTGAATRIQVYGRRAYL